MATLQENVAKVVAAHSAIKAALEGQEVTVPDGAKLSDMAELVEAIPVEDTSATWGRPSDWPRIDLIPMRGLSYNVTYCLIRKPADSGKVFSVRSSTAGVPWYADRITVSADGRTVTSVEGSRQDFTGAATFTFAFPADDPVGTLYALRLRPLNDGDDFYLSWKTTDAYRDATGVFLELITRSASHCFSFGDFANARKSGPVHIAAYGSPKPLVYPLRYNAGCRLFEVRDGQCAVFGSDSFIADGVSSYPQVAIVCDDDAVLKFNGGAPTSYPIFVAGPGGRMPPLSEWIDAGTGEPYDWATGPATSAAMFRGNRYLTSLTLPDGFGSAATNVSSCFDGCASLESLTLPDGFGSAATNVSNCFNNCISLASLTLPDGFGSAATNVSNCFNNCASLESLTLPDGFGSAATNVSNCFYAMNSLVSLDFGENSQFGVAATSAASLFVNCFCLTTITGAIKTPLSFALNSSPKLTHDSLMNVINGLVTVTKTQTLTIGATNKAKLTADEIAVATAKGWTVA